MAELLHGLLKIRGRLRNSWSTKSLGEINKSDTVAAYLATKAVQSMVSELKEESCGQPQGRYTTQIGLEKY